MKTTPGNVALAVAVSALSLTAAGCPQAAGPGDAPPPGEETTPAIELLAGSTGSIGNLDGPRDVALFALPSGVAVDADGVAYVVDTTNAVVRRVDADGNVTTLAGKKGERGTDDGEGEEARFLLPTAIVLGADDALYVSDEEAATIRRVTKDGAVTTFVGRAEEPGATDGPRENARLMGPEGLAVDADGSLFVADRIAGTVRKVDKDGLVTTVVGKAGENVPAEGDVATARLLGPFGLAVVDDGVLAISDADNNVVQLLDDTGLHTLAGAAGSGQDTTDGDATTARFGRPRALAVKDGALIVADTFNDRLRKVELSGESKGTVTTFAGSTFGYDDGTRQTATFSFPSGLALDAAGALYVADGGTGLIRKIDGDAVTTFAGRPSELEYEEGKALDARFFSVTAALEVEDGVLLVDQVNNVIRKLEDDGDVVVFAGAPEEGGDVEGTLLEARFQEPRDIVGDGEGGFYVSDQGNHCIKHIDADGNVTRFAGGAIGRGAALADGPLLEALFFAPAGLALDDDGSLYVADAGNHAIRKIKDGQVATLAGDGLPGRRDAPGPLARFNLPQSVVVVDNRVYVADALNHMIRVVDKETRLTETLAGTPGANEEEPFVGDADGEGAAASFNFPSDLLEDGAGGVLVADANNHLIRRVTDDGAVTTIAGVRGVVGVVPGDLPTSLFEPRGLGHGSDGSVLITFQTGVLRLVR